MSASDPGKLDRIVAEARRAAEKRERGYREQALKIYPWICGRCGREFTRVNVRELTVHHRDHDHGSRDRRSGDGRHAADVASSGKHHDRGDECVGCGRELHGNRG